MRGLSKLLILAETRRICLQHCSRSVILADWGAGALGVQRKGDFPSHNVLEISKLPTGGGLSCGDPVVVVMTLMASRDKAALVASQDEGGSFLSRLLQRCFSIHAIETFSTANAASNRDDIDLRLMWGSAGIET